MTKSMSNYAAYKELSGHCPRLSTFSIENGDIYVIAL